MAEVARLKEVIAQRDAEIKKLRERQQKSLAVMRTLKQRNEDLNSRVEQLEAQLREKEEAPPARTSRRPTLQEEEDEDASDGEERVSPSEEVHSGESENSEEYMHSVEQRAEEDLSALIQENDTLLSRQVLMNRQTSSMVLLLRQSDSPFLGVLPARVSFQICRLLDKRSRQALSCVNRTWRSQCEDFIREVRRKEAAKAVLLAERNYMRALHTALFQYRTPLLNNKLLEEQRAKVLFSGVSTMLKMHSTMFQLLNERMRNWTPDQVVGDVLGTLSPAKRLYTLYGRSFTKRKELLEQMLGQSLAMSAFCAKVELAGHCSLMDALEAPMKHIVEFAKLTDRLKAETPFEQPDRESLTEVTEMLSELIPLTSVAPAEEKQQLPSELRAKLEGSEQLADAEFTDGASGRRVRVRAFTSLVIAVFADEPSKVAYTLVPSELSCQLREDSLMMEDNSSMHEVKGDDVASFHRVLKHLRFPKGASSSNKPAATLFEGWLMKKKPGRLQAARRRYFVLGVGKLAYYTSMPPVGELLATIPLDELNVYEMSGAPPRMLLKADGRGDSVIYSEKDDDTVALWLQEIRSAKEQHDGTTPDYGSVVFSKSPRGSSRPIQSTWRRKKPSKQPSAAQVFRGSKRTSASELQPNVTETERDTTSPDPQTSKAVRLTVQGRVGTEEMRAFLMEVAEQHERDLLAASQASPTRSPVAAKVRLDEVDEDDAVDDRSMNDEESEADEAGGGDSSDSLREPPEPVAEEDDEQYDLPLPDVSDSSEEDPFSGLNVEVAPRSTKECTECGHTLRVTAMFCTKCGTRITK